MRLSAPALAVGVLAVVLAASARVAAPRRHGRTTAVMAAARLLADPQCAAVLTVRGVVRFV